MRGTHTDAQAINTPQPGGNLVNIGAMFRPARLAAQADHQQRRSGGKRSYTVSTRKRGRYIYARPANGRYEDIALDATARQAAPYQRERQDEGMAISIHDQDIQRKVRVRKTSNLVLFAVDASWSMAAAERMEATKGAIMSLLVDAYQKRDRVAMVSFQRDRASLVLPPTSSVEMAKSALRDIPVGGKTPLSAGLVMSFDVIQRELLQDDELVPMMILLTDGAGNVSLTGMPPREEGLMVARMFAEKQIHCVVINTEHESLDRGLAQELADTLGGPCYTLRDLRADSLYDMVRQELKG